MEHLTFHYNRQHIWVKHLDQLTKVVSFMTNEMHIHVVETMKNQVKDEVEFLISKLQSHFLSHGVMEVFGVVYLQYLMIVDFEESLMRQFNVIKAKY